MNLVHSIHILFAKGYEKKNELWIDFKKNIIQMKNSKFFKRKFCNTHCSNFNSIKIN